MPMELELTIKLKYDENFMELGDFRWEVQEAIKQKIINSIMSKQITIDFINKKTNEVLEGNFNA